MPPPARKWLSGASPTRLRGTISSSIPGSSAGRSTRRPSSSSESSNVARITRPVRRSVAKQHVEDRLRLLLTSRLLLLTRSVARSTPERLAPGHPRRTIPGIGIGTPLRDLLLGLDGPQDNLVG